MREITSTLHLRDPDAERWYTRAFGLDLDLGFAAPPLPRTSGQFENADPTVADLVFAKALRRDWPSREARRTGAMGPRTRPVMTVDEHPVAGYLIHVPPYGVYQVSADGREIACAPPAVGWWYWQRLLIGQVIPAAAALRGYEVLHASAVRLGDRALAFAGLPGAGKSSLAVAMTRQQATLLAEDVVVLGTSPEGLVAEPGTAMVNLRPGEDVSFSDGALNELGTIVGRSHGKVHLLLPRDDRPTPLSILYLLERGREHDDLLEPVPDVGASVLYPHTFVSYIYRPERLVRQLEIAALLSQTVRVFRLRVLPGWTPTRLATAVAEHCDSLSFN